MSDLERWISDGATDVEAKLLEAARGGGATPEARARIAAALEIAATGAAAAGAGADAGTASGDMPSGGLAAGGTLKSATMSIAKWMALLALGGSGAAVAWHSTHPQAPDRLADMPSVSAMTTASSSGGTPASAPFDRHVAPSSVEPATPSDPTPTPVIESPMLLDSPTPTRAPRRPLDAQNGGAAIDASSTSRAEAPSPVDSELFLLEKAKSELDARHPASALSLIQEYERRHPQGVLAIEAQVIRVDALVAAGRSREAKKAAEAFVRTHPTAAQAPRFRTLIGSLE